MALIGNAGMIDIMQKTLNYMDARLVNHGKRVAYLMFRVLFPQNRFSARELRDICLLAMLHDIGAYKTEEIDKMVLFETIAIWEHSIYGYLFLQYFSPLGALSEIVLYHHASCAQAERLSPSRRELAQLLSLCDRADFFNVFSRGKAGFRNYIEKQRGKLFDSNAIGQFLAADIDFRALEGDMKADKAFAAILCGQDFTEEEIGGYIDMVIYSIDFRSSQTVRHTVTMAAAARALARLAGQGGQIKRISVAAKLHDIGKIGTPVRILESTGGLSKDEMDIMKTHVGISEKILRGNMADDMVDMAVNHHEKLNGKGYLKGLKAGEIAPCDRIIAAADVFSALCYARSYKEAFPEGRVTGILTEMAARGELDPELVELARAHYHEILAETEKAAKPVVEAYSRIQQEYEGLKQKLTANTVHG